MDCYCTEREGWKVLMGGDPERGGAVLRERESGKDKRERKREERE